MRRSALLTFALLVGGLVIAAPARAGECEFVEVVHYVYNVPVVEVVKQCSGSGSEELPSDVADAPTTDVGCAQTAVTFGLDPNEVCDPPDEEPEPVLTPGMIAAAFRRVPLPPSELVIQPPNGRTLVNFDTNFYTETEEFTRTLTLLGQQVDLRIWPAEFGWRFGDGEELWTTEAGAAYPDLQVTHNYLEKGEVSPSVDTTYAAEFRVASGPWRPVPGSVTIPGASVDLEVVEASPTLVG